MLTDNLWEAEVPVKELDIEVPRWIDQDIYCTTVAAIVQGGCASGAYMPAVTYYEALKTMNTHGDDVLQYIEDELDTLPDVKDTSWAGVACTYLSVAVELWATSVEEEIARAIDDKNSSLD